jgi:DNA mismatch repair protein MutL
VRGPQHVFVNRRIVRDRTIGHAIQQGYSVATIKERSPEVHLFIDLPADRVDVNVHPTKAEVRFLDQGLVHEVLRRAIVDALGDTGAPELRLTAPDALAAGAHVAALPLSWMTAEQGSPATPGDRPVWPATDASGAAAGATRLDTAAGRDSVANLIRPMVPLGQFRSTFIIAADDEGLAIIDQHVAHERVLFERIMERLTSERLESQRLLVPMMLELSPAEREALVGRTEALETFGFEIEEFGGDTVKVTAVPALLPHDESEVAIRALAQDLDGLDRGLDVHEALKRIAATMACHAAVKANYPLNAEKMRHILDELRATAYSTVCPHGRPVMLRLTRREVEKNFERI